MKQSGYSIRGHMICENDIFEAKKGEVGNRGIVRYGKFVYPYAAYLHPEVVDNAPAGWWVDWKNDVCGMMPVELKDNVKWLEKMDIIYIGNVEHYPELGFPNQQAKIIQTRVFRRV